MERMNNIELNPSVFGKAVLLKNKEVIAEEWWRLLVAIWISDKIEWSSGIIIESPITNEPIFYGKYTKFMDTGDLKEDDDVIKKICDMKKELFDDEKSPSKE